MTSHLEESIIIGTLAISGSEAIRFKKRTIAAFESNIASSMLISIICAPFSTCCLATFKASSNRLFKMSRANTLEPVTLVRSPILTNRMCDSRLKASKPESLKGGKLLVLVIAI